MCLYVRVKFGLQSSFIESFMEILCSHYAQIFTFGWEDSPPSISLVVFFFLLYVISTRRGQKVLCIMPCELKNNVQVFNWYFSKVQKKKNKSLSVLEALSACPIAASHPG